MTDHLQEAKDHVAELTLGNIELRGHPADSEDMNIIAHALIAIAEQLETISTTLIDQGIAQGFWDESYVKEDSHD